MPAFTLQFNDAVASTAGGVVVCAGCGQVFRPRRCHARHCSGACRAETSRRRRLESARAVSGATDGGETAFLPWSPDPRFYRPTRRLWRE